MMAHRMPKNRKDMLMAKMLLVMAVKSILVCQAKSVRPPVMSTVPPTAATTESVL